MENSKTIVNEINVIVIMFVNVEDVTKNDQYVSKVP